MTVRVFPRDKEVRRDEVDRDATAGRHRSDEYACPTNITHAIQKPETRF